MKRILLIGGGGHCHSVIDSIIRTGYYDEIGIVDDKEGHYDGISVVGQDKDIGSLRSNGWEYAFVTVGSIGDTTTRRRLYSMIKEEGFNIPSIIDPSAILADSATVAKGSFVGKGAIINSVCRIGECAIVNSGAVIEHDCTIGSFAHVSSGAVICGDVKIGDDTHIGAGSVVRQSVIIGSGSLIGVGSVITKDIPDNMKGFGNPFKVIE